MPRSPASDEWVIDASGMVKTYRQNKVLVPALRGVDLRVAGGEMVAVMGPSGCGKTTLLNCLSGLDDVDEGSVAVEGNDLAQWSDDERTVHRAQRMGFIFQAYNLLPVLTAVENVELPLLVTGAKPDEARQRAEAALQTVGLGDRLDHTPKQLSGGQQQRVTIARSIVNDPAIVFADEPTGNLDSEHSLQIVRLMKTLNQDRGQTYVIVTHSTEVANECDRIIQMRSGRIESETARANVKAKARPPTR